MKRKLFAIAAFSLLFLLSGCRLKVDTTVKLLPDGRVTLSGFVGADLELLATVKAFTSSDEYPTTEEALKAAAQEMTQDLEPALKPYGAELSPTVKGASSDNGLAGASFKTPPMDLKQAAAFLKDLYRQLTDEDVSETRLVREEEGGALSKKVRLTVALPGFGSDAQGVVSRTLTLKLPGKVVDTDGEVKNARTVVWSPGGGAFEGYVVYRQASSLPAVLIVAGVALLVVVALLASRRKRGASGPPPSSA